MKKEKNLDKNESFRKKTSSNSESLKNESENNHNSESIHLSYNSSNITVLDIPDDKVAKLSDILNISSFSETNVTNTSQSSEQNASSINKIAVSLLNETKGLSRSEMDTIISEEIQTSLSSEKIFPILSRVEYYSPIETSSSKSIESLTHSSIDDESSKYNKINSQPSQKISISPSNSSNDLSSSEKLFPVPQDEKSISLQNKINKSSSLIETVLSSKINSPAISQTISASPSVKISYLPLEKSLSSSEIVFPVHSKTSSDISQNTISYHLLPTSRKVNTNVSSSVESSSKGVSRIISKGKDIIYKFPSPKDVDFAWIAEDFSAFHPLIRTNSNH